MTDRIRIIIIVLMVLFIVLIIKKLHSKLFDYKFGIFWIIGASGIIFLALFPSILDYVSTLVGVETPVNLLFFLGLLLSFLMVFQMAGNLSKQSNKIKSLTQELGILKHTVKELEKSEDDN